MFHLAKSIVPNTSYRIISVSSSLAVKYSTIPSAVLMNPTLDDQISSTLSDKPRENTHIERTSNQYRQRVIPS